MPRTGKAIRNGKITSMKFPSRVISIPYRAHASHPMQMPKGSAITKTGGGRRHSRNQPHFPARAQTERQRAGDYYLFGAGGGRTESHHRVLR